MILQKKKSSEAISALFKTHQCGNVCTNIWISISLGELFRSENSLHIDMFDFEIKIYHFHSVLFVILHNNSAIDSEQMFAQQLKVFIIPFFSCFGIIVL